MKVLLRDLLGGEGHRSHRTHKGQRLDEILDVHAHLPFVLIGDSLQDDPDIYAELIHRRPGRILAVYIRDPRLSRGSSRVEPVVDAWNREVPFVMAADSAVIAEHAARIGLIDGSDVEAIEEAVSQ